MQLGASHAFRFRTRCSAAEGVTAARSPRPPQQQHRSTAEFASRWPRSLAWLVGPHPGIRQLVVCPAGGVGDPLQSGSADDDHRDGSDSSTAQGGSRAPSSGSPDAAAAAPGAGVGEDLGEGSTSPLTLGSAVLERMAKLRALDQYRALMAEVSANDRRRRRKKHQPPSAALVAAAQRAESGGGAADDGDSSALLLRGALLIARHRYPSLDEGKVYGMLDDMSRRVGALLPADPAERYPLRVVAAINRVMYTDFGFRGNEEDYYNADNSCINRVMERRAGIPITLSLVYSEVARRVGLPMRGLNLPGHFMLQPVRPPPPPRSAAAAGRRRGGEDAAAAAATSDPPASTGEEEGKQQQQQQPQAPGSGGSELGGSGSSSSSSAASATSGPAAAAAAAAAGGLDDGGATGSAAATGAVAAAGPAAAAAESEEEEEGDEGGPLGVLVDAFRSGEVCLPGDAEERLSTVLGSPVRIDPRVLQESQPLPPRMFLLRMLGNLRSIYLSTQQVDLLLDVLKFMRATLREEEEQEHGEEGEQEDCEEDGEGRHSGAAPSSSPSSSSSSSSSSPGATSATSKSRDGPKASSSSSSSPGGPSNDGGAGDSAMLSSFAAASAALARDEGLCYFALQRYPECLEALKEYVRLAEESGGGPLPPEEAKTVSVVMEEARRRMTQQQQGQ